QSKTRDDDTSHQGHSRQRQEPWLFRGFRLRNPPKQHRPAHNDVQFSRHAQSMKWLPGIADDQLLAFFSRNLMASPTVKMVSAASSGISQPNSSSKAMTSSTVSRLSAPRSSMKLALSTTLSGSTPKCSTTIFFTRSPISLIAPTSSFNANQSMLSWSCRGQRPWVVAIQRRICAPLSGVPVPQPPLRFGYHTSFPLTSVADRDRE